MHIPNIAADTTDPPAFSSSITQNHVAQSEFQPWNGF